MQKTAVIGIGNMGSGLAKNLISAGFATAGYDVSEKAMQRLSALGGEVCHSSASAAQGADSVFIMVMNGDQVASVIFGDDGLLKTLKPGATIILTATIKPREAQQIGERLQGSGIHLIDSPVSGGFPGAQNGTLTLMAAAPDSVLDNSLQVLEAVSANIHRVGKNAGDGQKVKSCLQALIGGIFSGVFEAAALAAKAGVSGQVLLDVCSTSSAGSGIVNNALEKIIDRQFEGTGSHAATMHKDLTIALDLAQELGVPMHTASTAFQLFQTGLSRYPAGDNWAVTQLLEEIARAELHR